MCGFLPLIADDIREPDEYFFIAFIDNFLVNFNPLRNVTRITIVNDDCEVLPNPSNGLVILSGTTNGSMAMYECDTNFILIGSATRVCQSDALWSGEEPFCLSELIGLWYMCYADLVHNIMCILKPAHKMIRRIVPPVHSNHLQLGL